ncbi:MAG: hypothetical protein LIP28_06620 [Deltaproteobacteria bacterium]|nr:hypothetical protein [Deltaproteobacteria bacterium]
MKDSTSLLRNRPTCKTIRRDLKDRSLAFIDNRLPDAPAKKMLLDAMRENPSLLGSIIQMLNGMTLGLLLLWFAVLALLLILNIFIHPHHPHFVLDAYWGFWAVFGLGVGVIMVYVMKRIIQPLIVRKEDYYGDI